MAKLRQVFHEASGLFITRQKGMVKRLLSKQGAGRAVARMEWRRKDRDKEKVKWPFVEVEGPGNPTVSVSF